MAAGTVVFGRIPEDNKRWDSGLIPYKMVMNLTRATLETLMEIAIDEAKVSLRQGNSGFGAVIEKDGRIIVQTHDTDRTDGDLTAHAELKAIKAASAKLGKNLKGCLLVSTHEPCPMCATNDIF